MQGFIARLSFLFITMFCLNGLLFASDFGRLKLDRIVFADSVELKKAIGKKIQSNINFYRTQLKSAKQTKTLNRQIKEERILIQKVLEAYGFYNEQISANIYKYNDDKTPISLEEYYALNDLPSSHSKYFQDQKLKLGYKLKLNKVFRIQSIEFNNVLDLAKIDENEIPIKIGASLRAQEVLDAFELINQKISENQCFIEGKLNVDVQIDKKTNSAFIEFKQDVAKQSYFKSANIAGIKGFEGKGGIDEKWILAQLGLKKNQCLNKSSINNAILKLYATNLLARVSYTINKIDNSNGSQSVVLNLVVTQRKHRTIASGVGLSTANGLYLSSNWQHRNVFEKAEQINVEGFLGSYEQSISADITIPKTKFFDTGFSIGTQLNKTNYEGEEDFEWINQTSLTKRANKYTVYQSSLVLSSKFKVEEFEQKDVLNQLYIPTFVTWDERDDEVNTSEGIYLKTGFTPVWDIKEKAIGFIDYKWLAKGYYTFDLSMPVTFAIKHELNFIDVKQASLLPEDERIYLGGGSNMRGFAYQSINADDKGGEFSNVLSFETRVRFSDTIGLVGFYDVGRLKYDASSQDKGEKYQSAGLGVRYYTSFFPIRFDVAMPVNIGQSEIKKYQFYLSIGQSY